MSSIRSISQSPVRRPSTETGAAQSVATRQRPRAKMLVIEGMKSASDAGAASAAANVKSAGSLDSILGKAKKSLGPLSGVVDKVKDWFGPISDAVGKVKDFFKPISSFFKPIQSVIDVFRGKKKPGELIQGIVGTIADRFLPGASKVIDGAVKLFKNLFGGNPRTNVEQERWQALAKAGYPYVPPGATDPKAKQYVPKGQSIRPDLPADFKGVDQKSGEWVNNSFSNSRNESDLTGKDIWGYAAWAEKFGARWMQVSPDAREKIANEALRLGLVREHHGTIDINFTPELEKLSKDALGLAS